MKNFILLILVFQSLLANSQSKVSVTIKGLASKDSALVRIQKSSELFKFKYIGGTGSDINFIFDSLKNGSWAISIDAKGYLFPASKVINLNNNNLDVTISLTPGTTGTNFNYSWEDDSSFVGHAQQAYINDKVEINVLGKAEKVPDDFNAINALNEYGFLLSDDSSKWTSEDSYRLYQTLKKLNFKKYLWGDSVKVKAKWILTESFIDRDIDFKTVNGVDVITVSRAAFTYATPQVVTVDGVKGKFFSKRLYTALVYYYSDKGINKDLIAEIAKTRYGFEFLAPSAFLRTLMNETETNFQEFTSDEKIIILSMFEEFPDAMQRQEELKYMVRRVNGQSHPIYPTAPAIAWVTKNNIEWMESAFISQDITYMQRLVLHEKAHFLWEYIFDNTTQSDWAILGGWFKDPTALSGWSTSNTTEFVSAYAHLKNPNEDMAESIAFFITNPEALRSRSLRKFEFIRDRIMKGTRYISVIRPDLTFRVYNLFPDYNYPGKIKRTKLDVIGGANEDKKVIFEVELTIMDKAFDGAQQAQCRFMSSIGTIKDMWLNKVNASGSILRGEFTLSKYAKSGYWIIPQINIWDAVGNQRLENNSTYGVKCFVNNPLEDINAPLYVQNSLKMDSVFVKINSFGGNLAQGADTINLQPSNAIRLRFNMIEKNTIYPDGRALARIYLPTFDSTNKYNIQPYSFDCQIGGNGILNDKPDSLKTAQFYFPIPDYFPSGYYSVSFIEMQDLALNARRVFFDKDTANKNYFIPTTVNQRAIRDSIYMKTKYPDLKPPVIDLNDIKIQATPTNPIAPNGETLFEMWLWIKDESDFVGKASGFAHGYYTLRDPQGLEHIISMQSDLGNLYYTIIPDSSIYGYKRYYFKSLLPAGSPPGIWGVSAININDHAQNKKYYSFVEYVRFDVEQSNVLQVTPYVEILDKKINSKNVDSVAVKIGCVSCKNQNYRLRMYSSMGGNSVAIEGKMTKDTITLTKINLKGVNDGILYATVFILDSTSALIGTGRAAYSKDVLPPKSAIIQSNISNFGKSNLDSLSIDMKVSELNGEYFVVIMQNSIAKPGTINFKDDFIKQFGINQNNPSVGDTIILTGKITDTAVKIKDLPLSQFQDGLIELQITFVDSVGNPSAPVKSVFYKDTKIPVLTITKKFTNKLKGLFSIESNEYLSNNLTTDGLILKTGLIDSLKKISNRLYNVYISRVCNDTVSITLKANAILDTVGNKNISYTAQFIDTIIPFIPIITASKPLTFCPGDSTILSSSNASNNQWYKDGAAINGSTAASITINSSGVYTDTVVNDLGCKIGSASSTVLLKALIVPPTVRDTSFCQNSSSSTLTATSVTGNSLKWYGTNATGGTVSAAAIVASTTDTTTKSYYVSQINNTSGCESPRAKITVKINPVSANPIVRDTAYCFNLNADTLKASSLTGHSLNWYGTSATGGTASALGNKPSTSVVGSFSYYVSQKNNTTGCESPRAIIGVVINPLPLAPTVKDTAYCNTINADTLRVNAIAGTKLLWYGTNATGGVGNSTAIKPSTATVGTVNYYLSQMITATGCEGPRSKIVVIINPMPSKPIIAWNGTQFTATTSSTGVNYQWLLSNISISAATSATYKPAAIGSYKIQITDANGCKNVSDSFMLVVTAVNPSIETPAVHIAKISPNPASTDVVLYFQQRPNKTLTIKLLNLNGQVLKQINTNSQTTHISLSEIISGNYIINIIGKNYNQTQQLLIIK